jgi:PTS system mannose-specific IIB component
LYCDEEEVVAFRALLETGLECIYQTTPEEPAIPLKKLIP